MSAWLKIALLASMIIVSITGAYADAFDISTDYSAEMNGMAGAGMAHCTGGMAIAVNPAGMAGIRKFNFSMTLTNMVVSLEAPANGPGTGVSSTSYAPIGGAGMAYRAHDNVIVGFFLFAPSGGGSTIKNVDFGYPLQGYSNVYRRRFSGRLAFIEFGPAVAIDLPYGIKIGVVYRINFVENWANLWALSPGFLSGRMEAHYNKVHLSGYGFDGIRVGMQFNPVKQLHIGVAYRNPVRIYTSGKTRIDSAYSVKTEKIERYAERYSAGITYEFVPGMFLASLDYEFCGYSRYKYNTVETMGLVSLSTPTKRKDAHWARLGFQVMAHPRVPVRFGVGATSGSSNKKYHNITSTGAPGYPFFLGLGSGYRFDETWELNLSVNFLYNTGRVPMKYYFYGAMPGYYSSLGYFTSIELICNL
jgi:long-subunit fatty acid transport protein